MSDAASTVRISLDSPPEGDVEARDIRESLSAVVQTGPHLWLGCDETATLERVTRLDDGGYGDHRTYRIEDVLDLPGGGVGEVDVEGLAGRRLAVTPDRWVGVRDHSWGLGRTGGPVSPAAAPQPLATPAPSSTSSTRRSSPRRRSTTTSRVRPNRWWPGSPPSAPAGSR